MNIRLPDITSGQQALTALPLRWVGMEGITVPLLLEDSGDQIARLTAKADIFVSLDKRDAKGIHMSRLFIKLNDILGKNALNGQTLTKLLHEMVLSQKGLSQSAKICLKFDVTLRKKALISNEFGFQSYPVVLSRQKNKEQIVTTLSLTIPYSSTCPCSSALSRQALSDAFAQQFSEPQLSKDAIMQWLSSEQGTIATPHSQRSFARIELKLLDEELPNLAALILQFEQVIGTPLQTAVKREDEQAFAKLNAANLMFCEDAARRLKQALEQKSDIIDYWFKVEHQESLHAHNAVAIDYKETSYESYI